MKQITIPTTKQQKQFEDLATTLLKTIAQLSEDNQNAVLEYAFKLSYDEKNEQK